MCLPRGHILWESLLGDSGKKWIGSYLLATCNCDFRNHLTPRAVHVNLTRAKEHTLTRGGIYVPLLSQIPSVNRKQSENLVRTRISAVTVSIRSNYQ